jgi:signal transduction histidine kinase/mono/diheme cytochrome c family protein
MRHRPALRAAVAVIGLTMAAVTAPRVARAETVDFSRDIQPLLAKRCYSCHGPDTQEGGLRLDDAITATRKLDSGARAIVPSDDAASEILARITSDDPDVRMPPEGSRLTATQVETLRRWITQGAEFREHWAFRPVVRPEPPTSMATNPIDAFVRDTLARRGLPAPSLADRRTLLRRATYGVTGLPPTEQEMRDFLADDSPQAWEKVVDRLLASPHYGEKWARHWLDLVRYADTNSFERDGNKPHAWRYRDYVIRSLNDDKPYDRFVIEQLAGDELPSPSPDDLIATGYYRLGLWDDEPADRLQARYDWLDDLVSTTGQTFLGLTINCARCHDHKIDPIPQKDYYSLLAFFQNVTPMANDGETIERKLFTDERASADYKRKLADLNRRRDAAQKAVTEIENRFRVARDLETGMVVVTHNRSLAARADRILLLENGRLSDVGARHEVAALRKDGSTVHVELIVSEVVPKQLFTAVMRDVTERKESDARLRQSDRLSALGALAAGLGHDMNNVLLPVRAHLNVLAAGAAKLGHTECTGHINEIGKSVVYLQQLADGLHYLVTDAGHADGGEDGARLAAWWAQSGSLLSRTLPPLSKVKASIPAYLPMVRVSAHALTQAVLNLFVNAGEAIAARGDGTLGDVRIGATVTPDGRAVVLSVRDNGIGMSEAVRARAQDMFFTTKSRGLGTGLGLAMVSRIATECGGSLSIASEPGKGTTMSLVLPVVEDETDTSTRIALTSDDGRAAALLQSSLRAHGFASVTIDEADDADVWVADPRTVSVVDAKAWLAARTDRSLVLLGAPGTDIRNDWRGIPASVIKTDFGIDSLMAGVDRVCSIIHRRNDND